MSLTFHWFIPTNGDSRHLVGGPAAGAFARDRPASIPYLGMIARAAEDMGFTGALSPTGPWCEDAWLTTAMVAQHSERLKFLVAFRPGIISPMLAAQMASTYQRHTQGRLLLNVVTGGESHEQRAYGDFLGKDDRYRRSGEFLEIAKRLWQGEAVTFQGEHIQVENAELARLPDPVPDVYFGGSSPVAGEIAARHADVYLTWGEPPHQVAEKINWVKGLAEKEGRTLRFGIRLHCITRDTSAQAWAEADRLLSGFDEETLREMREGLRQTESLGQQRMFALHNGNREGLEIYPNLWAGIGLVRGGAGTALVGSHDEVVDRIKEYAALGIDEFIFSGFPLLEEVYTFGEGVLPRLAAQGLWQNPYTKATA
ncbi:LLM class flavin-dependent oxidoreductase [Streptomyces roseirectus]|uniref:LLM class flavin-dependent oxidoreductase n=1 Tax=Streptomyces roseirectus TaxID=2768066 RepID=A0A7H0IQM5_9ACTN|nr:LLM class flavin-dependent oxidoreductase [Streptomyces roseirectus]QNP75091.1 LLM class flavin-dependent oxidoreductase [Streptomyces roseirectus]